MAMIYATGHLSGAHINPAVTIAFTLTRHFPPRDALVYIAAQLAGATAGALILLAVWPDKPADLGATVPTVGAGSALLYEVVLTALLMFVIMAVATDTRAVGAAAAIAIGGTVGLDALFGGAGHGRVDEPGTLLRPRLRLGHVDGLLGLRRRPARRRRRSGRSPTSSCGAPPCAPWWPATTTRHRSPIWPACGRRELEPRPPRWLEDPKPCP